MLDSARLTLSSSQSNLVHSLAGSNPSKLLLDAIKAAPSRKPIDASLNEKDEEYYLGELDGKSDASDPLWQCKMIWFSDHKQFLQVFTKVYNIISGDPSRGSLALGGDGGPPIGARVQVSIHLICRVQNG